jgi:A/G-specific adenine glycosylase
MTLAASSRRTKSAALLAWYDRHHRELPWRAAPGVRPDPYRVWLSEVMLQQTTVKAVAPYYARFLERFPSVVALAEAEREDVLRLWAGLGYYARARNLHDCAQVVATRHDGRFPGTVAALRALPGIGDYTAAAIAAIAFDVAVTPVDGNVERVITRLHAIEEQLPAAKPRIRALAADLTPDTRSGDFAQALMDLGATICTPKKPACALCPWSVACSARARGDSETFPRKSIRSSGELRRGAAFVVLRADDHVLLTTRTSKGLLGGMTEVPNSDWSQGFDAQTALAHAPRLKGAKPEWRRIAGSVRHVFTHFPLELDVYVALVPQRTAAPAGMRWVAVAALAGEALPSLMRKVIAHADIGARSRRSTAERDSLFGGA